MSEVPAERWHAALASTPEVAAEVIGQLARKLQAAHEDAGRLVFDDCNERLVKTLLRFSHSAAATRRDESGEVTLRITHQQLAQAVGAARETISLALTHLRQRDLLRTGRNQLFFNPDVLRQVCKTATSTAAREAGERGRRESNANATKRLRSASQTRRPLEHEAAARVRAADARGVLPSHRCGSVDVLRR